MPEARLAFAVSLLAGCASAGDHLLVSAYNSDSVSRFDAANSALLGQLSGTLPDGVLGTAIGPDGALYVTSENEDAVLRYEASSGAYLGAFIRDDPATAADETGGLDGPSAIVFGDSGRVYVASFNNDAILEYDARSGAFVRVLVASGQNGLNGPDCGMALGPDGNLYVPSFFSNRVVRFSTTNGAPLGNFATNASAGLVRPRMVVFRGSSAFITSEGNDRVVECDASTGAFVRNFVWNDPATPQDDSGGLDGPTGIAFGPDGRVYVASLNTNSVLRYDAASGAYVDTFLASGSGGMQGPTYVLFRPEALVYGPLAPNSAGAGASLTARGFASAAAQTLALELDAAPPGRTTIFFYGAQPAQQPFADGWLLVDRVGALRLGTRTTDAFGRARWELDFAAAAGSTLPFVNGSTRSFQAYFRDPLQPQGSGANLSRALAVAFGP